MGLFDKPTFEARPAPNSIAGKVARGIDAWIGNTYQYDDDAPVLAPKTGLELPPLTSIIDKYSSELFINNMGIATLRPTVSSTSPSSGVSDEMKASVMYGGDLTAADMKTERGAASVKQADITTALTAANAASDAAPVAEERSGLMAKQNQALRDYTRSRIEGSMTAPESASMYDAAKWSNLYDKDDNFSNSRALKALKSSIPNDTQRALLEGVFKVEVGNNGPKSELGYGNLTGAQAASDPRTRGTDANSAGVLPPETIARRAAFRALDNNPAFTNGSSTTRSAMIFDIFYNDANRTGAYKLGNTQDGDGSLFQGRGFTQITGRDNYTAVQNKLAEQGIDVDLLTNPELVNDRRYALPAALAFWDHIGLNADTASSFSAKKLNNKVNSGEGAAKAKERWGYVVSSLRSAGNADEADAMELRNEYAAQEKVGLSGDSVDGSIGNTSKTAMNTWLTSRGVNVPDGIDTMDLVILVNSTPVEAE